MLPVLPESWCYDVDIDSRDGNSSLFCLALLKGASIEKKNHEFFLEMWKTRIVGTTGQFYGWCTIAAPASRLLVVHLL